MSKKNYTFSLSKDVISISKERAKEERRSLSNLVKVALESYVNGARASKAYNAKTYRPIEESNEDKTLKEKLETIFNNNHYGYGEYDEGRIIEDIVELIEGNEQSEQTYCQHSWETSKFYPGEYFCGRCHEYKADLY